ncbi:hypothetical protein P7C71_g1893, partial [Lecanoromycetidae sp. Uapishka_2]
MRIGLGKHAFTITARSFSTDNGLEKDNDVEKQNGRADTPTFENQFRASVPPKLAKFQTLVGICSPSVLRLHPSLARPAPNEGIYKRTCDEEEKVKFQYASSNYIVNISMMLQIVLGAALTALGAANGPKAAVTVLGAANTIMAGMLTYLRGQGLPNRLEQYLHLLRTLREHIEERERALMEPDCPLDVDEELKRITKMYQEVRQTKEDNAPGVVLPPRGVITSLLEKPDVNRSDVAAPRGDKGPESLLATGLQDLSSFREMADAAEHKYEAELTNTKASAEAGAKSALGAEISHLESTAKSTLDKLGEAGGKYKSTDHGD